MSENGEIYTAGENFTLPPALTAWTNSTSDHPHPHHHPRQKQNRHKKISNLLKDSHSAGNKTGEDER